MKKRRWYWLLIVPFIATLWPPFYAHADPPLFGFPFFYWYQLLWVVLTAGLVWGIYVATRDRERE